ncbi:MAG: hypothetical protein DRG24_09355 [Epsilonproteobacteria bacterium]|nr:MAG: hypothetical protein DRG24_09355 [Campylobacterota bacterium]
MKIAVLLFLSLGVLLAKPYNSNVLIQRGIDPQILNLTVSSTRQNVAYKMAIEHSRTMDAKASSLQYFLIFDPFASYGVDMRIQIPKEEMESVNAGDIKERLDKIMAVQLHMQHGDLFDPNSLAIQEEKDGTTIITFGYNVETLPREMKYFANLKGYVHIVNGVMEKIIVKNIQRFEMNGKEVDSLEKVYYFTNLPFNGGYLLKNETVEIRGTYDGQPYREDLSGEIVDYWNDTKQLISFESGARKRLVSEDDAKYETIFVELDRTFPLLGKAALKAGYDLPQVFGVSMITMLQETTLHMTSFSVDGQDLPPWVVGGADPTYTSRAMAGLVRADMWLLPFLNVGVILGGVSSETTVKGLELVGQPLDLPLIETSSVLYGLGTTLAGGIGNFFATVDMQYITAYTEAADVELSMMIATPLVGYTFENQGVRLMLGGQYQDMKEELTATVDGKKIVVGLVSEKWAGLIGVEKGFSRHWNGSIMYSQGDDRKSFNMMIGYRF